MPLKPIADTHAVLYLYTRSETLAVNTTDKTNAAIATDIDFRFDIFTWRYEASMNK